MKRKLSLLLLSSALFISAAHAKNTDETISVYYRNISLSINSEATDLYDATGKYIEPFLYNNTTYLPLRAVAQALDMSVSWDAATYTVGLTTGESAATNPTGEKQALPEGYVDIAVSYRDISVNLNDAPLDLKTANGTPVEPFLYNNTVYLPLRNIAEATSSEVAWDGETGIISITTDAPISTTPPHDIDAASDWTAEEAEAYGYKLDFKTYADENYAFICGYTGTHSDVLIPAKIDGKTTYLVGGAGETRVKVFEENEFVRTVTMETGVEVGSYHSFFRSCPNLKAVYNLPDATGGASMFTRCPKLEYISNIPESLTHMNFFLHSNSGIRTLENLPKNIITLASAFTGCTELTGDIFCHAPNVTIAENIFKNTKNPITFYVPFPSTTHETLRTTELPQNVTLKTMENRIAYLPKELYIATDVPITLYNEAIAPSYADKTFRWTCDIGTQNARGFSFSPAESQIGEYPLSVEVFDGETLLYKAETVVKVVSSRALSKNISVVTLGYNTSLGKNTWMKTVEAYTQRVTFLGTRTGNSEGRSLFTTASFLKDFEYENDQFGIKMRNPFYNPQTSAFDMTYYKNQVDFHVNAVLIFLLPSSSPKKDLITMIEAIREDSSETPIFIASPHYRYDASKAMDASYFSYMLTLDEIAEAYDNLYLIPTALSYDRKTYFNPKYKYLPDEDGFAQLGRTIFSTFAYYLQ